MKIPLPMDDVSKGMMMSGSSTGRKELIHELRETSLIGGNALQRRDMVDKAVQSIANMDLGSGDTSDFVFGNRSNYESFNEGFSFNSYPIHQPPVEPPFIKINVIGPSLTPQPPPSPASTPPIGKIRSLSSSSSSSSSESVNATGLHDKSDSDHFFKGKENKSTETKGDCTVVVVEEGTKPNFRANESNPTVPSPKEPSKTSTLRLSDRPRSESEDDIEKVDDPDQDGSIFDHKALYKAKAITEDSQNSEKMDKNGNKSDGDQNEVENDCIVECLYYTIQCCECVTF